MSWLYVILITDVCDVGPVDSFFLDPLSHDFPKQNKTLNISTNLNDEKMPRKKESSDEYEPEGLGGHNSSGSGKNLKNDSRQFLVKN